MSDNSKALHELLEVCKETSYMLTKFYYHKECYSSPAFIEEFIDQLNNKLKIAIAKAKDARRVQSE